MPTTYRDMSSAVRLVTCVGYNSFTLRSGSIGMGASFNTIAKQGMRLSEMKPTGYLELAYYQSTLRKGFKDMVTLTVLDDSGDVAKDAEGKVRKFVWTHTYVTTTPKHWEDAGHWYRFGDTSDIISTENDEIFGEGEGLWIYVGADVYNSSKGKAAPDQIKMLNNGEALMDAKAVTLRSGSLMVGAPLSADVKLSTIIPTGYLELAYYQSTLRKGFKDMVTLTVLDDSGDVAKDAEGKVRKFVWTHTYVTTTPKHWEDAGHWYRFGDTSDIISTENDETFKMGEALWIYVGADVYNSSKGKAAADQIKVGFPGIDD